MRGVHLKRIWVSSDFSSAGTKAHQLSCPSYREATARNWQPTTQEKEGKRTKIEEVVEQDLRLGGLEVDDAEGILAVQEEGLPTRRRMNANLFTKTYVGIKSIT